MTERAHRPYHERRVDQQILDALLRIEDLLIKRENPAVVLASGPLASLQNSANQLPEDKPKGKRR